MNPHLDFIRSALDLRRREHRLRTLTDLHPGLDNTVLSDGRSFINVSSNDYLGLAQDPHVRNASQEYLQNYGSGSTASRLITGTFSCHSELERELSAWLSRESTLVFNSGYQMNVSILSAIADKNTHLYLDRTNHNSLIQGALLSRGKLHRYRHLDYDHLNALLSANAESGSRHVIVSESIFSMDGDLADVARLAEIAEDHNAILVIDEAHAIGVCGPGGRGYCAGIDRVDLLLGTFGKAFGSFGAFV